MVWKTPEIVPLVGHEGEAGLGRVRVAATFGDLSDAHAFVLFVLR